MTVPHPLRKTDEADAAIQATPAVAVWPVAAGPARRGRRAAPPATGTAGLAWALALGAAGLAAALLIVVGAMVVFWPRPSRAVEEPIDRAPAKAAPAPRLEGPEKLAVEHAPDRPVRAAEALEPAVADKAALTETKPVRTSKEPSADKAIRLYEEGTRAVDLADERFQKKR